MNKGLAAQQKMKVCYFVGSLKLYYYFMFIQRCIVVFITRSKCDSCRCTIMKPCSEIQFNAVKTIIKSA